MGKLIDQTSLDAFVGNDTDMLVELTEVFGQVLPSDLQQLGEATESGNAEAMVHLATKMKERFDCFSAPGLSALASELQCLANEQQMDGLDELVQSISLGAVELLGELHDLSSANC
ncbi:MAG: hypothetical protein AB8B50_06265 [Pirellulaceae bacterium]